MRQLNSFCFIAGDKELYFLQLLTRQSLLCLRQYVLSSISLHRYEVWHNPFHGKLIFVLIWNEVASSNKKKNLQKNYIFSNFLIFTSALSIMINMKIILMILILMSCNSILKMGVFVKLGFCSMEFHDRKFTTKLFDKRDGFSSNINRMPYLDSNLPSKIFYSSFGSELLHTIRTTADLADMVTRVNVLLRPMKIQGRKGFRIISLWKKVFRKHFQVFHKFWDIANGFIKLFSL